jgi:hypothetical protein
MIKTAPCYGLTPLLKGLRPFNSGEFDVDAYVICDRLAEKIGGNKFRTAPELLQYEREIQTALEKEFPGIKAKTDKSGWPFSFRVWTKDEFQKNRADAFNSF